MDALAYTIDWANREIRFNRKPGAAVRGCMKSAGMRWNPQGGYWYGKRLPEPRPFEKAVDSENGVRRPDGPCWICKNPNGFFRARGAATPVWCDECARKNP